MNPEILIVGDPTRTQTLARHVQRLGYRVSRCSARAVVEQLGATRPATVLIEVEGTELELVMADIRESTAGAAVPVSLVGRFGDRLRGLADVLDLGADHFIETPVGLEQLSATLEALAGPAHGHADSMPDAGYERPRHHHAVNEAASADTADLGRDHTPAGSDATGAARGASRPDQTRELPLQPGGDPVMSQVRRTLELLERRLKERRQASDEPDDLEQSLLDLEAAPQLDDDVPAQHAGIEPLEPWSPRESPSLDDALRRATEVLTLEQSVAPPPEPEAGQASNSEITRSFEPTATTIDDKPRRTASVPIERQGQLATIEVPRLLWRLQRVGFTGLLTLTRGRASKRIWLQAGRPVFARSNLDQDRFVDDLLQSGTLTQAQYEAARRLVATDSRRAGQVLVAAGFIKPDEVPALIRHHLTRIVDGAFGWNEGQWSIVPGGALDETILLTEGPVELIWHGVRLRVGARQLLGWLGGRQQIPRLRPDRADDLSSWANALDLSGWERQVLEDLDGHRSLGELLEGIARAVDLLALVYVLHVFEIIDLLGEPLITDKSGRDPAELDRTRIEARLRLIHDSDYFAVLGVERTANAIDIRRAYRDLTTTFADDRLEPQTLRSYGDALRELRAALDEAYFVLSDEALRSTYLAHLEEP